MKEQAASATGMDEVSRILVVDDNPMNRDLLCRRLQRDEHAVEAVESGLLALERLAAEPFDVVLLDIMMPDLDGYAVLSRIKEDKALCDIPVIMISALGDAESVVRCLSLGADDYLTKPFDPLILRARVSAVLAKKRLHDKEQRYTRAIENELNIGRAIQAGFLPETLPRPAGWEIAMRFHPARQVAGDFYDAFDIPGFGVAITVADVCDKGVGAALYMALFRSLLRATLTSHHATGEVSATILKTATSLTNDYIANVHERSNMFATIFFGILDPDSGRLDYVNAGHDPPIIVRAGTLINRLEPTAPAMGMFAGCHIEVASVMMEPGDLLLAYTDGVVDAASAEGPFGEERLIDVLTSPFASADGLLDRLDNVLDEYSAGREPFDDITMIALLRKS